MKLDGKQVFCHGTGGHKPNSNPFEYNENALESIGLKSGNETVKENQKGLLSKLPYAMNDDKELAASKLDFPASVGDLTQDNEMEVRNFLAPVPSTNSSAQRKSFEKDPVFYMDKNVMERELPDIVCYKESGYHVVKDICVDEGVPTQEKFLFDKSVCADLTHDKDINSEMVKERLNLDTQLPEEVKYSAENEKVDSYLSKSDILKPSENDGSKNDSSLQCDSKEFFPSTEVKDDVTMKITAKEIISLGDLLRMPKLEAEFCSPESSNDKADKAEQKLPQMPSEDLVLAMTFGSEESENGMQGATLESSTTLVSAAERPAHGCENPALTSSAQSSTPEESDNNREEAKLVSHGQDSVTEEPSGRIADELSYNGNMETGAITYDFDSSAPTVSCRVESSQNGDSEHHETQTLSRFEDANADPVSSQLQYGVGESSFSAAGPLSGLITYSGPVAYSGSVSLRSDSSTTSARSFAFPVLQSEWNSSPVRMAKANQRHYHKRRWTKGFFCCGF